MDEELYVQYLNYNFINELFKLTHFEWFLVTFMDDGTMDKKKYFNVI